MPGIADRMHPSERLPPDITLPKSVGRPKKLMPEEWASVTYTTSWMQWLYCPLELTQEWKSRREDMSDKVTGFGWN